MFFPLSSCNFGSITGKYLFTVWKIQGFVVDFVGLWEFLFVALKLRKLRWKFHKNEWK